MKARKRIEERRRREIRRRKDLAAAAVARGRLGRAAELFAQLSTDCPEDPQILVRLGEVQRRRGREAEAITAFLRAAARLTRNGHLLRAIAAYRLVLEIAPGHEGAHALLADLHERRLGRPNRPPRPELPPRLQGIAEGPGPDLVDPNGAGPSENEPAFVQALEQRPRGEAQAIARIALAREAALTGSNGDSMRPDAAAEDIAHPPAEAAPPDRSGAGKADLPARRRADSPPKLGLFDTSEFEESQQAPATPAPSHEALLARNASDESGPPPAGPIASHTLTPPVPVHRFSPPPPPPDPVQLGDLLDAFDFGEETPGPGPVLPPIPLFADLDPSTFQRLILRSRRRLLGPGDRAVSEGEPGDSFFVVVRGSLEVVRTADDPTRLLGTVEEGDFFGEMALLTGTTRNATVWAVEESELLQFEGRELRALVRQQPQVAQALRRFYRQRLLSNVLATSSFFNRVDRATSEALIARFRMREVAEGERLVEEGRPVDGLFVALHGRFEVVRGSGSDESHVAWLGEGELFGEHSLLTGGPAGASCVARRRGMVLRLPRESFEEVMDRHPDLRDFLQALDDQRTRATG